MFYDSVADRAARQELELFFISVNYYKLCINGRNKSHLLYCVCVALCTLFLCVNRFYCHKKAQICPEKHGFIKFNRTESTLKLSSNLTVT